MKKILLITVLAGFVLAGCSKDDIQSAETQNRTDLKKTSANGALDPRIEQFVLEGAKAMDDSGKFEYIIGDDVLRRLCQKTYFSDDGVMFVSGSYEQYGTLIIRVVRSYILKTGVPIMSNYTVEVASPLWDCNDLPGEHLIKQK